MAHLTPFSWKRTAGPGQVKPPSVRLLPQVHARLVADHGDGGAVAEEALRNMTKRKRTPPLRHPVSTKDREGYYVIEGHMITVTATKGAVGHKTAQVADGADVASLAALLLAELAGRRG